MGASWPSCSCPSYLHTQLCFPSEPIFNRFPQRHYRELPSNHNSLLTRTCSTIPSFGNSPTLPPHSILPHSHLRGTYSFKRAQCSSLKGIRVSTELLEKNFFQLSHCNSNSPQSSSIPLETKPRKHEPISQ